MAFNNLYPPIVPDIKPSFIKTSTCYIFFALSPYVSINEINQNLVHVTLINQKTNKSFLNTTKYPLGIKLATMNQVNDTILNNIEQYEAEQITNDYSWYIQINPQEDLQFNSFEENQIYKVQLRFTAASVSGTDAQNYAKNSQWFTNNIDNFSQWSSVCLIKGISLPTITLNQLDYNSTALISDLANIIGKVSFNSTSEKQHLKSYHIELYPGLSGVGGGSINGQCFYQSPEIYTSSFNPNEINYELNQEFQQGNTYAIKIVCTTNNLYKWHNIFTFTILTDNIDRLNANITTESDIINGRIKISIISKDSDSKIKGKIAIRRTSSESNFKKWEDVHIVEFYNPILLNYIWYDTTIKSGVWYKYCAQSINNQNQRSIVIQTNKPIMCLFEDMFLTRAQAQLKIQFNPSLSEFKYNVTESQQTTLGGKYPFIKRNSNNYFRSFPIGGLISAFIDQDGWYNPHFENGRFINNKDELKQFTSKDEIYGPNKQLYEKYNEDNNITNYYDYIYEREFRERVYDFLYSNNVKLFRSTTEGNILVKLMNIDFQPVETLSRMLYSFTATAVEIDEINFQNYEKYGICIKEENYSSIENIIGFEKLGQIQKTPSITGTTFAASENVFDLINTKHANQAPNGYEYSVSYLKFLRIEIENPGANTRVKINNQTIKIQNFNTDTGEVIGFYELNSDNVKITQLSFLQTTRATIDYIAVINQSVTESGLMVANHLYYTQGVGQLYGTFNENESLMSKIYNKYYINGNSFYRKLNDVYDINVEADQGTVLYVKDSGSEEYHRYVLSNGYLQLKDDDCLIEGIYFCGRHLTPCPAGRTPDTNQFVTISTPYRVLEDITNPITNGVYSLISDTTALVPDHMIFENNNLKVGESDVIQKADENYILLLDQLIAGDGIKYIYYQNQWYPFTSANDVLIPTVDGIVNYSYEVVKGVYN